ncbi:MAG: putative Histidine kinase [Gammaproteobacteria bacterium]|jgi:signal transduction histidine kinase/response regulator of citrate/malate metabolism|nr:putative Histidine kinase [Gammaproteobacteria bacterium]
MSKNKKKVLSTLNKIDVMEILNLIPGHIYWKDKDGYFLGCNQSQAVDLGFNSSEELIGKTDYDFLPLKVAEECRNNDLKVMQSGIAATFEEDDYISKKIPLHDKDNKVIGILGVSVNFKEYKDYMDRAHHILDEIIAAIPGHVYWKDRNCNLLGCNEQQAVDAGLRSRQEIVGKSDYDLLNKNLPEHIRREQAAIINEADKAIMESDVARVFEESAMLVDGKEVTYLSQKKPLHDNKGEVIGLLGISVDITELKKAKEQAEAASKAKTEFVQNMQHDIRTPSSGLWGVLNVLAQAETDPDKKEALDMAVAASKRLLDLCNDAVEFGDLSGNTRPILEKALDIRELAQSVIELNKPAAFTKDLLLHFKVTASVPAQILGDEFRLNRILVNLIGNAIKFTHKGEVTVNIDAKSEEGGRRGVLTLEIKDTGIGITGDKVKSIYDKFSRAVLSNSNKYPGTGLGLYVVKTFVDELDGDIEVHSQEHSGTCFKLSVPFKVRWEDIRKPTIEINECFRSPLAQQSVEKQSVKAKTAQQFLPKTPFTHELLIVEDDKTCLFAEKNLLSAYTSKIDCAETVAETLEKLAVKRYDLVICDLGLPDGSGCDIVAQMKNDKEALNHETPFVAMTAHKDAEKLRTAMAAGFSMAETKPLGTDIAVEILNIYPALGTEQDEGLPVIDLALGMQRIGARKEETVLEALGILLHTLDEDIPLLQEAEKENNIEKVREILHKIRGGLYYSGTPRLEESFKILHEEVRRSSDLRKIDLLFSLVYGEVTLLAEQYQELIQD